MTAPSGPKGTVQSRRLVISGVLALIALPFAWAFGEAVSFHVRNRNNGTIVSSGRRREYLLHVPRSYDRAKPSALVISMHAAALWPAAQMEISGWNKLSDEQGFIVVYPSGAGGMGPRIWHAEEGPGLARDVRFISELIDALEGTYHIDPTRIYADGLSNGGGMAFVLSCTLSDRIAAVGMVAAAQLLPWSWCTDSRPVPMMTFHGTADPVTPYNGGRTWVARERFPSIPTWTAHWARRNGCGENPVNSIVAPDVTRLEYTNCTDDARVVLYRVEGGGHGWPGGRPMAEWLVGSNSLSVDATRLLWAFFRAHPLRAARSLSRKPLASWEEGYASSGSRSAAHPNEGG